MKGMNFKKAFLLGGIFLLTTFMSVQYSWGCDDKDKWGCDDHDKWDWNGHDNYNCNKHIEPCHPPKIQIVYLDYNDDSIKFTIWGENFDNGAPPVVTLGGRYNLNVGEKDYSDTHIIATLQFQNLEGKFIYGDYKLVVSTCHDSACECKYCKDHCSKCKDKYCIDYCSKCKDRYCEDQNPKCKDKYCLTISGPPGAPGIIESVVVENVGAIDNPITPRKIDGHAYCDTDHGYTVTGGGFKSNNLKILESRADGNGWYVMGRITNDDSELPAALIIYAVCAKIQ
jgi:hypothetical protein